MLKHVKSFCNSLPIYPVTPPPSKSSFPGLSGSAYLISTVKYKEMVLEMHIAHFKFKKIAKQSLTEILVGFHALMGLWGKKE